VRAVFGQARADYIGKSRDFSFLALMALCLFGAFWFVPREIDGFEIMALQPDIFIQGGNPSWIPVTSALGLAFFLPFIAFFYLRNTIAWDEEIGMSQLITSSTVGNLRYLIGKFLAGTLLLFTFAVTVIIGSFFMALWHFPGQLLSLYAFLSPYMFLLASLPLCAAIAVLFGAVRFLRGVIGSIIYVMGVFVIMVYSMELENAGIFLRTVDVTAISSLMEIISRTAYEQTGYTIYNVMFIGGYGGDGGHQPTLPLVFEGLHFNSTDFIVFGTMLLIALGIVFISAPLYGLSKLLPKKIRVRKAKKASNTEISVTTRVKLSYSAVSPSQKNMWARGVFTEMKLMLKGKPLIWFLGCLAGITLTIFLEMNMVFSLVLPLLMLWLVNVFSPLGNREHNHDMLKVIATINGGTLKQVVYSLVAGLLIALTAVLPFVLRMVLAGQFIGVFVVLAGVVFLPSFALFLGEFTKTNRAFEVLFILLTYAAMNGVPVAMYMGCYEALSVVQGVAYLLVGASFGVAAILKRLPTAL